MYQVLKVVSERTVRKTGPSTWLPVWLHELEEFPDEYVSRCVAGGWMKFL